MLNYLKAELIGNRLKDTKFDAVFTSDLGRAHHTAKIIVSKNETNYDENQIQLTKLAREQDCPGFEHKPYQTLIDHFSKMAHLGPDRVLKVKGGESREDVFKRAGELLIYISDEAFKPENQWKNVFVVSHQAWICESQNFVANYNTGTEDYDAQPIKNCSVSILEVKKSSGVEGDEEKGMRRRLLVFSRKSIFLSMLC